MGDRCSTGSALLPCPFCGVPASYECENTFHIVRCYQRGCAVVEVCEDTLEEASRRWNTRASQPVSAAQSAQEPGPCLRLAHGIACDDLAAAISERDYARLAAVQGGKGEALTAWFNKLPCVDLGKKHFDELLAIVGPSDPAYSATDPAVEKVILIARDVVWFDWSKNDTDAVHAIDQLRLALSSLPSTQNSPPVELAPQNSAERIPSSDAGSAGGEAVPSTTSGSAAK